jgi:anti-sigma regulatory factor (Ser/Thr protein kinase)
MPNPFEARIPGTPLGVRMLRREMTGMAKDCGMDSDGIADVRLAVTEAATNAVIHAYAKAEGELMGHRRDAGRRARDRHR